jgi:hypothetical protein
MIVLCGRKQAKKYATNFSQMEGAAFAQIDDDTIV